MRSLILGIIILIFLLSACQSAPPSPTSQPVTNTEEPSVPTEASIDEPYPYPPQPLVTFPSGEASYPAPQGQSLEESSGESAYPVPGSEQATMVTWEEAQNLILDGQVVQVTQLHNLTVFLTLEDGSMVQTLEPNIDDVFDVVEQCGDPCADIGVATE